jgi:hypothetical protein
MRSSELGETSPSPSRAKILLDKNRKLTYENTSFDYEFASQPCDGRRQSFESNEVL